MITPRPNAVHLLGINGSGMRSLADYLLAAGHQLTGADSSDDSAKKSYWEQRGVPFLTADHAADLPGNTELLVHSLAVPETNPVRVAAKARLIPDLSYPEILGRILKQRRGLGIAGTHGKSTTAALLFHLLQTGEQSPGLIAGGKLVGTEQHGYYGASEWLVTECCEFRQAFLQTTLERAALLAVEPDHFDCYPDEAALLAAFEKFCQKIPRTGLLVVNGNSSRAVQAARKTAAAVEIFQVQQMEMPGNVKSTDVDWAAIITAEKSTAIQFLLRDRHRSEIPFELPLFGRHQVGNAVAAILLARSVGLGWETLQQGLSCFPGVERRFQDRGMMGNYRWIDDYAHHPTEIRATLEAARQKFPGAKISVLFQPHQILRTERLLEEFAAELGAADRVSVLPVFAARERIDERCVTVSQQLVKAGNVRKSIFQFCPAVKQFCRTLDDPAPIRDNPVAEVIVVMGAGDIDRIFYELSG